MMINEGLKTPNLISTIHPKKKTPNLITYF